MDIATTTTYQGAFYRLMRFYKKMKAPIYIISLLIISLLIISVLSCLTIAQTGQHNGHLW